MEKYSSFYFFKTTTTTKTSGKSPLLAVILFCSLIWQNRSYYLVYPHGNLTVYRVVYIFSANAGLRQPVRSAAGDFRGSLKFARYDQNTSLMPCSPCMRGNIFTGMTEEARGGKATFVPLSQGSTSALTCSPRSSLKKSFAGIIGFLIRYEVSSRSPAVLECCDNSSVRTRSSLYRVINSQRWRYHYLYGLTPTKVAHGVPARP